MKEFVTTRHKPFGTKSDFAAQKADGPKMLKLVKLVGMLSQIKVYLFWSKY